MLNGRPARHRLVGVLLVLLSGMAIAVVPTSAKLAFEAGANTLTVVTLRGIVAIALMVLFMAAFRQSFRLPGRTLMPCAAAGLAHALFRTRSYPDMGARSGALPVGDVVAVR